MKIFRKTLAIILALSMVLAMGVSASAITKDELATAVDKAAAYMVKAVTSPQVGSIGGEWAIIGLARSGADVPEEYYQGYYSVVEEYVKSRKGVLHEKKYTEYSRVIVALSSIGKDPTNVGGYNLLEPLGDFDKTIWQGINGPIWALIALDTGNYAMPENKAAKTQATRQMYVDEILRRQLPDGGFNLNYDGVREAAGSSDPELTGMALQALAKYQSQPKVKDAIDRALTCLSKMQASDGGFSSWGTANSESVVQVIVALAELGIPLDDARFIKKGNTLLDNLLSFQLENGSFLHTKSGAGQNQMASEQGFYGIVAALRLANGQSSLYRMTDAISIGEGAAVVRGIGLPGKNADVKAMPITAAGTSFEDAMLSKYVASIEALAARGIITGRGDGTFMPELGMNRAEFCTIATRGLGLEAKKRGVFSDVPDGEWYAGYVDTANAYGLVNGPGDGTFNPLGNITRQEAAVLMTNVAKLCGIDTELDNIEIKDALSEFGDYVTVPAWAQKGLAFCYSKGILDNSVLDIKPAEAVSRGELADMMYKVLLVANLI